MQRISQRIDGFHGFAVQFSPFDPDRLICAASAHFGVIGTGCLFVLRTDMHGRVMRELRRIPSSHGLFDATWSEWAPSQVLMGGASGALELWDVDSAKVCGVFKCYRRDVCRMSPFMFGRSPMNEMFKASDGIRWIRCFS